MEMILFVTSFLLLADRKVSPPIRVQCNANQPITFYSAIVSSSMHVP